jgi:tetratricopeptide (TPR) repeat protein
MLPCLNRNTVFLESSAYLYVPHQVHQLRARGLLVTGKIDEALKEIRTCLSFFPADVETPILLAPILEKNGRKREADDLFAKVFIHREQLCADYPSWAQQHNDLAWLGARCRRQLDKALIHARKAVELAPNSASYLDTLAEVHFQLGDQAKAVELMRRCLELDPRRDSYRLQLKRFEAGDRFADVPRE